MSTVDKQGKERKKERKNKDQHCPVDIFPRIRIKFTLPILRSFPPHYGCEFLIDVMKNYNVFCLFNYSILFSYITISTDANSLSVKITSLISAKKLFYNTGSSNIVKLF